MTYELSGPDAIGWDDLAALAAELSGRDLRYRAVDDDEYRAYAIGLGFPEQAMDMLLAYYAAVRAGWAGTATGELARPLGRPPTASIDAVRQALAR
jgi:NAD(P)H dehydrogenase (quinone)